MLGVLHVDLFLIVIEYLLDDPASLSRLSLVNRAAYNMILPVLYAEIYLHDIESMALFSRTISSTSQSKCNTLVRSLWIEPRSPYSFREVLPAIGQTRSMLEKVINLQKLTFIPLNHLFADMFIDLEPKFQLTHFSSICYPHNPFFAFLHSQPSITHLTLDNLAVANWRTRAMIGLANHCRNLASQTQFLPRLCFIEADSIALAALCSGRPIRNIVLNDFSRWRPPDLVSSISRSAGPVRSLTLRVGAWYFEEQTHPLLLESLKSTPVASSLQDLSIILDLVSARNYCHCVRK